MIAKKMLCAMGVLLFAGISSFAQEGPKTIAAIEFQTPKNGMLKQYEEGRKQKAEWHKQQKDAQALYVFEVLTGQGTGSFLVGRFGVHWADLDKPSVSDAADLEQYQSSSPARSRGLPQPITRTCRSGAIRPRT